MGTLLGIALGAGFLIALLVLVGIRPREARTLARDDEKGLDRDVQDVLAALRSVSAPDDRGGERRAVERLRRLLSAEMDEVVLADAPGPERTRFDLLARGRVALEVKIGRLSASEIQRAVGQIRQYARIWDGALLLVLLSEPEPRLDAQIRAELADPALRERAGGPVLAAWKTPTTFRVVG